MLSRHVINMVKTAIAGVPAGPKPLTQIMKLPGTTPKPPKLNMGAATGAAAVTGTQPPAVKPLITPMKSPSVAPGASSVGRPMTTPGAV